MEVRSGDIFRAVSFQGEELLDTVTVVALQLDRVSLDRPPAGKFSLHKFRKVFKVNVRGIEAFNHGNLFPVPAFVDFDIDPLLFLCYLLTDTQFLGKSTRRANATNHYSYF